MCEKSVDKTESSSNLWRISPLNNDENESTDSSPTASSTTKIEIKHLGVEKVDPNYYSKQYGTSLQPSTLLPEIAQKVKQVDRITLAAEQDAKYFMGLEGDIHALCMIDLVSQITLCNILY